MVPMGPIGKQSLRLCRKETLHFERSSLTTRHGCLFGFVRKKTAHAGETNAGELITDN